MKYLYFSTLVLIILMIPKYIQAQELKQIESLKINKNIHNYYLNSDSSITIKIVNKKGILIEEKHFTNISKKSECGKWIKFYPNSQIKEICFFDDGLSSGIWIKYDKEGNIFDSINYNFPINYYRLDTESFQKQDKELIINDSSIFIVEDMPLFNGQNIDVFRFFLQSRLKINSYMYDKYAKTGTHKIYVQFAIDTLGNLTDIKVDDQNKKLLEKEVVRVVKKSPKWTPGYQNNSPVKVQFTFPVYFYFPK